MAQETPRVDRQLVVLGFLPNHCNENWCDLRKKGKKSIASRQRLRMMLCAEAVVLKGRRKSERDFEGCSRKFEAWTTFRCTSRILPKLEQKRIKKSFE